ncbi:MAG: GTP cyclohydrolase II [Chakrabartia godavariana]
MSEAAQAARAIDALRRGWPVALDGQITLLSIETADSVSLTAFDPDGRADILISAGRAFTLKLANQIEAAVPDAPVLVARRSWLGLAEATALADPALDLATPMKGPFEAIHCATPDAARAALTLARHAGLLPAFFVLPGTLAGATAASIADIDGYEASDRLRIVARARLPVEAAEQCEIVAFRTPEAGLEHVALLVGSPNGQPPLVRLHSECLTGDVLGSLKCDCGPQLHAALRLMADNGWGILLYLRQEGRGIGLINKLRAYALQDQGFDTVDANTRLGFAIDARDFSVAARMLTLLGQDHIRLLTNNPEKVARLQAEGVTVIERVPHKLPPNPHNARYLDTKRDRTGHAL